MKSFDFTGFFAFCIFSSISDFPKLSLKNPYFSYTLSKHVFEMLQYFPMSKSLQFTYVFDDLENSIDDVSEALFFGVSATGKDINVSSMIISI